MYLDKVMNRFDMNDSKKGFIPMSHGVTLSKTQCASSPDEQERMSRVPYASAIGSIMYAMLCMRSDISYALSVMGRYQSNPVDGHWVASEELRICS